MASSYIGLVPSNSTGIQLPENPHLTLAFMEETNWDATVESIHCWINMLQHLNPLNVTGFARFRTPKNDALVMLIEPSIVLVDFRQLLVDDLSMQRIKVQRRFSWTPHITISYVEHAESAMAPSLTGTVDFNILRFKEKDTGKIKEWNFR